MGACCSVDCVKPENDECHSKSRESEPEHPPALPVQLQNRPGGLTNGVGKYEQIKATPMTSAVKTGPQPLEASTGPMPREEAESKLQAMPKTDETSTGPMPQSLESSADPVPQNAEESEQLAVTPVPPEVTAVPLAFQEPLHLAGTWTKWSTNLPKAQLQHVPGSSESVARLSLCAKLTSMSLSFQVVSAKKAWAWRLFPRDAKPAMWGAHVAKEGKLSEGIPDAVIVGLGDSKKGHGLNFHIIEAEGTIVTVWVEVPVRKNNDELELRHDTVDLARVWYTREDTGIQITAGDGIDLNKYKKYLPAGMSLPQ